MKSLEKPADTLYISLYNAEYSRSESLLTNEQKLTQFVSVGPISFKSIRLVMRKVKQTNPKRLVVCSPSHILVPFLRILGRKPITLDAGWPLSDSNFTRAFAEKRHIQALKNHLLDFLAFRMASKVVVESIPQKKRCEKKFKLSEGKVKVVLTGLHEARFESQNELRPSEMPDTEKPIIFFRGKYNSESGLGYLFEAVPYLADVAYIVIATDVSISKLKAQNLTVINRKLLDAEMKYLYKRTYISVGQISNHSRIKFTIPHKFFESAYFGVPYITMESSAVQDASQGKGTYSLGDSVLSDLIYILEKAIQNRHERNVKAKEIELLYKEALSQEKLQLQFQKIIKN